MVIVQSIASGGRVHQEVVDIWRNMTRRNQVLGHLMPLNGSGVVIQCYQIVINELRFLASSWETSALVKMPVASRLAAGARKPSPVTIEGKTSLWNICYFF